MQSRIRPASSAILPRRSPSRSSVHRLLRPIIAAAIASRKCPGCFRTSSRNYPASARRNAKKLSWPRFSREIFRIFCAGFVRSPSQTQSGARPDRATFIALPDYLAIGYILDFVYVPLSPSTAQQIADALNCSLPTRKMVDAIYSAAAIKLPPIPIARVRK